MQDLRLNSTGREGRAITRKHKIL